MAFAAGGGYIHPDRMNLNPAFAVSKDVVMHNNPPTFTGNGDGVPGAFDFGAGQPLPPSRHPIKKEPGVEGTPEFISNGTGESPFRSLSKSADRPLLDYLSGRKISPYFLTEIDMFLDAHPEIAYHQPRFANNINLLAPLDVYKFFIKGYTKPARYVSGALPDLYSISYNTLPPKLTPIAGIYDTELVDFFGGYEYRVDILQKIDLEVARLEQALLHGDRVTFAQRKLLGYTLWGNVADAFKFYEYNYQEEWLAHRYLPEHVVLSELPKRSDYSMPVPRQMAQPDEENREDMRSHPHTRARMARANDQGVDVIEVLLEDFTAALCRQGLRREEIEFMRREAIRNINHQRNIGGSRDIVDLVMNRAHSTKPEDFNRRVPKKEATRMTRTQKLAHSLRRLLAQERSMYEDHLDWVAQGITKMRQRLERELVYAVTASAQRAGVMSIKDGQKWCSSFTRKEHEKRENLGNRIDLFRELPGFLQPKAERAAVRVKRE